MILRATILLAACAAPPSAAAPQGNAPAPRLAVVLVVDQMRSDLLDRFRPLFTGGFARLLEEGLVFPAARHLHAQTSTGPGHATLATGAHPGRHGVVANSLRTRPDEAFREVTIDAAEQTLDSERPGRSPRDLLVPAVGDWLKEASPRSKVVALAYKGRSAILLGGRRPDACAWADERSVRFTTSTYYGSTLPEWIRSFNEAAPPEARIGESWRPRLDERTFAAVQATADAMPFEGRFGFGDQEDARFPHAILKVGDLVFTPFADERVLALALHAVATLELGHDDAPDLLLVSLSAADYIGHAYGPDSREVADYFAWLDGELGRFLAALEGVAGAGRLLLALSSDHGVSPVPEWLQSKGQDAGRIRESALREAVDRALDARFGAADWVLGAHPDIYLDRAAAERLSVAADLLEETAAAALRGIKGVAAAYPRRRFEDGDPSLPEAFRIGFHPARSGDVMLEFARFHNIDYLETSPYVRTNHGTQHAYDQRVPLLWFGGALPAGIDAGEAATVDLAPTLARLLGVPVPRAVDGRPLAFAAEPGRAR